MQYDQRLNFEPVGLLQSPKNEEKHWLRGEGNNIKCIDFRYERRQVLGFLEGRRRYEIR